MHSRLIMAAVLLVACAGSARAEGWLPIWNPFASTPAKPAAPPTIARPAEPTLWQRTASGTQQAWSNTTRLLNPWSSPAPARPKSRVTGTKRTYSPTQSGEQQDNSSWLPWTWFQDDEPAPTFETPSDWLAQPRPS